ncbi:MAG: hypothetical protein IKL96_11245, partial [Kiritimatiellae bacterium]|nr:hypothetical protein [Kiritimatiellia bacterium]
MIYKVFLVAAAAVFAVFSGVRGDMELQAPGDFKPLAEAMVADPAAVLSPQMSQVDARAFKVACGESGGARVFAFSESSGTHERELVLKPGADFPAGAAEVWYPSGRSPERPFMEEGLIRL